jgi:hypothetical protein
MDLLATTAELRQLREQPQWRLLAADKAPIVLALLKLRFEGGERRVAASLLHERVGQDLQALRAAGEDLPRTPQAYVADWLAERWIARRLPAGAPEGESAGFSPRGRLYRAGGGGNVGAYVQR